MSQIVLTHALRQATVSLTSDVRQKNMKRDFELIRKILREVEDSDGLSRLTGFEYDGYDKDVVTEHIEILIEADLLRGKVTRYLNGSGSAFVTGLTWAGHDFLDSMKDEGIWSKAKDTILKPVGGVAFDVLKEWLKWQMKQKLGLPSE